MIEQTVQLKTNISEFDNVLPFCVENLRAGKPVTLLTLINIVGKSPRPLGSQIAVTPDRRRVGMITGGCAEEALVKHAMLQFNFPAEHRQTTLRLGADSPWVDIRLPCGAGIDVHFSVVESAEVFDQALARTAAREPCSLELELSTERWTLASEIAATGLRDEETFVRRWDPQTRILIVGEGHYADALDRLAIAADYDTERCGTSAPDSELLDSYTAVVLLTHDHGNEPAIFESVLQSDCFYVGALGSRDTHRKRAERLTRAGVSQNDIARIHGPIGLPIQAKSPHEIAVSILAEITKKKRQQFPNG